jgi:hypothetical protein
MQAKRERAPAKRQSVTFTPFTSLPLPKSTSSSQSWDLQPPHLPALLPSAFAASDSVADGTAPLPARTVSSCSSISVIQCSSLGPESRVLWSSDFQLRPSTPTGAPLAANQSICHSFPSHSSFNKSEPVPHRLLSPSMLNPELHVNLSAPEVQGERFEKLPMRATTDGTHDETPCLTAVMFSSSPPASPSPHLPFLPVLPNKNAYETFPGALQSTSSRSALPCDSTPGNSTTQGSFMSMRKPLMPAGGMSSVAGNTIARWSAKSCVGAPVAPCSSPPDELLTAAEHQSKKAHVSDRREKALRTLDRETIRHAYAALPTSPQTRNLKKKSAVREQSPCQMRTHKRRLSRLPMLGCSLKKLLCSADQDTPAS